MKYLILSLLMLAALPARAGWDTNNAWDSFSAEFLYSGRDLLHRLEMLSADGKALYPTDKLRKVLENVVVASQDHVYIDNIERDANTQPAKNLITINRARWEFLRQTSETKARLKIVLHELFWFFGDEDKNFAVSNPIIEQLDVTPYSPSIWLNTPGTAFATSECTGQLADGSFVTVVVNTKGATKSPDRGEVKIESGGNTFGYRFKSAEMAQFFESDDADTNTAVVGLGAYVGGEFPVEVKYEGPNYVDMDLKVVIQTGGNKPGHTTNSRNFLNVWKGPGFKAEEMYKVENPVCSVWSNN